MSKGFSLIEALIAMTITITVGMSVFELFRRNERVFRDEAIVAEVQQSARAAAFQIADDIRIAGEGVPVYSATFDPAPDENTTVILDGSGPSRINFRAGISNAESRATSILPLQFQGGFPTTLTIEDAAAF